MFQLTLGDRLRRVARENGERELGRYRYNRLSDEEKVRHAEISEKVDKVHAEYERLLQEKKFDEAREMSKREMDLWDQMIDLMVGEKKEA